MASVYLAREIAHGREVAIKIIPYAYPHNQRFISRFKREAQVAARFVMSYIPGGTFTE